MTTNNDQPDPLGKLMSGVRQYLVELPRDVFDELLRLVEEARAGAEPDAAKQPDAAEPGYPAHWTGKNRREQQEAR